MSEWLPRARVVGVHGPKPPIRGVLLAIALVAGWHAGPFVLGVVGGVVGVWLATSWGLRRWIGEQEDAARIDLSDGPRFYQLRLRWHIKLLMVASWGGTVGCLLPPFFAPLASLICLFAAVVMTVALIQSAVLRPSIFVGELYLELPRSGWSRERMSVALEHVRVSANDESDLWLHLPHGDQRIDVRWLGEDAMRELAALLRHRTAALVATRAAAKRSNATADAAGRGHLHES